MLVLAGIQVVLGSIWIVCNLTYIPDFQETRDMLKASETLVFDEYMGILYSLILRLFSLFGDWFYVPVYILQLAVAAWSYFYLLRNISGNRFAKADKKIIWLMVGYLVTFPMILQCHMSILPYSLTTSLLAFLVAEIKYLVEEREAVQKKRLLKICVLWLLVGLLIPDYGVITAFLVGAGFAFATWKQRKRILMYFCIMLLTITTLFGILYQAQTPGSYGRMQRSVNSVLMTRFVWPYFEWDSYFWIYREWMELEDGELAWISMYPENVFYEFGPKVESIIGKEDADVIYGLMAKESFFVRKKDALKALGRDILANAGGPFALQYQLSGRGVSYTAWNYYQMQGNTPGLTKYFVKFAIYVFEFLLLMALCFVISRRKSRKVLGVMKKAMPALLGLGAMVLWYTMIGNGMQDYLKVVPVSLFWCMLPLLELGRLAEEPVETDEK